LVSFGGSAVIQKIDGGVLFGGIEPVSEVSAVSAVLAPDVGPVVEVNGPPSVVTVEIGPGSEVDPPTVLPSSVLVPVVSLSAASNAAVSLTCAGTAHPAARRSARETTNGGEE
jgi:hypothetical protein